MLQGIGCKNFNGGHLVHWNKPVYEKSNIINKHSITAKIRIILQNNWKTLKF